MFILFSLENKIIVGGSNHKEVKKMGTHLKYSDRVVIEKGIENGSDKVSIARTLGKDKSTITLEIKKHRKLVSACSLPLECKNYQHCQYGRTCKANCHGYEKFVCKRRDRSPGACNGCTKYRTCHFNKFRYSANIAENEYKEILVKEREGFNLTETEAKEIALKIKPLLDQGLSLYSILQIDTSIQVCEKSLYTYIEEGLFKQYGIDCFSLRRQVSRKLSKPRVNEYKKRVDRKHLIGRTYADYLNFKAENKDIVEIQMDTVYNNGTTGPFLQTFKIIDTGFFLCIHHKEKTAKEMLDGVDIIDTLLAPLRGTYKLILLTDRGGEFIMADEIEKCENGIKRFNLFYCNPMNSFEKGSLENNHIEVRYICPKGTDLEKLGLVDQNSANKISSNLNSFPKENLRGKTAFETLRFYYPELIQPILDFGIIEISKDKVVLSPQALK